MTTNSYGSALPRFDFEPLRPAVARVGIARALPLTTGIYAVPIIAAAGIGKSILFSPLANTQGSFIMSQQLTFVSSPLRSDPGHEEERKHCFFHLLDLAINPQEQAQPPREPLPESRLLGESRDRLWRVDLTAPRGE